MVFKQEGDYKFSKICKLFHPGTLKTSFNEKGKEIFKLEQLASDNIISDQGR